MRIPKERLIGALEFLYLILAFLLISDALTPLLYSSNREALDLGDSNPMRLALATIIYAISAFLIIPRMRGALDLLLRRPEVLFLILLPIMSVIWAPDVGPVFRRAVAQALTILFCIYVCVRYTSAQLFDRLVVVLFLAMTASLIVGAFLPSIGVTQEATNFGAWKGVFGHKAIAGRVCAFSFFICLVHRSSTRWIEALRYPTLVATLLLSYLSQSRASWLLIIAGAGATFVVAILRWERVSLGLRLFACLTLVAVLGFAAFSGFDMLIEMMGRDATMSGRTKLWEAAIQVASDRHPWLGSGFRDFWLGPAVSEVARFKPSWVVMPNHGHNGYLDTWLELGWVGEALLVVFLIRGLFAVCRRSMTEPQVKQWSIFAVCIFVFVMNNISATVALRHTDLAWVMVLLASLYSARPGLIRSRATPSKPRGHESPGVNAFSER